MPETAYLWTVEGAALHVELDRETAIKLRETVAAAGAEELGGFLLGTVEAGVTRVTGFQLVEIEHRRGEAYDLTPLDRLRFARRLAPWQNKRPHEKRAVGFFRTHVRPGLFLDEHDFRTVQEFFADPSQVVLLVRPETDASPVAGFFFWEAGEMERRKSYRPFSLDDVIEGHMAAPGSVAEEQVPAPVSAELAYLEKPAVADLRQRAVTRRATPERRGWDDRWKYGAMAACIPLVAGLAYYAGRSHGQPDRVAASKTPIETSGLKNDAASAGALA